MVIALATLIATAALAPSCSGAQLAGTFAVVPGSAGAGNIVYDLRLRNVSKRTCTVTGLPDAVLLSKAKRALPTRVRPANPGALAAVLVTLKPGQRAHATARFSPDVPGPGEGHPGRCEPVAYWLRVRAPGGGTATVPVKPPTSVCSHGYLSFTAYSRP